MIIPHVTIRLVPPLVTWWAHRRSARDEFGILAISVLTVCALLLVLARIRPVVVTSCSAPNGATGFPSVMLPLSVFLTSSIAALPLPRRARPVSDLVAIALGEHLLLDTWVA